MPEGLVTGEDGVARCAWANSAPEYRAYHDTEWGFPVADDIRLFEKLSLEGFQSGLSWLTILRKREAFRRAFAGFDFEAVARFGERDVHPPARRRRDRPPPRQDRGGHQQCRPRASSSSSARVRWPPSCGATSRPPSDARLDHAERVQRSHESGIHGPGRRAQATGLAIRRPDDRLRFHAGDGPGQRPPGRLRHSVARAGGADGIHPPVSWTPTR